MPALFTLAALRGHLEARDVSIEALQVDLDQMVVAASSKQASR